MTQFKLPLLAGLAAAVALSLGGPALAVTAAKPVAKVAAMPAPKPAAKSAPKPAAKPSFVAPAKARPAANGRMVSARQSNGKAVTYNCSLAGNKTKQACKR